ncbi:MAG: EcsC family protein [Methylovirgula sp.]
MSLFRTFAEVNGDNGFGLTPEDAAVLRDAVFRLEHVSFAARLSQALDKQIGRVGKLLPTEISEVVDRATQAAIKAALEAALSTLGPRSTGERRLLHKAVATLSGAVGGAFGLASLPVELPFSTVIMLRAIAAIAQAEGEDLAAPETAFACLQVFALGTARQNTQTLESGSGYFAVRSILAKSVTEAARFVVERGFAEEGAPVLLRLVSQIATRFGVVVSQKAAVQAVPLIGAAGGGAVNYAFIDHFQTIALGHFAVRRLERIYGAPVVRAEYDKLLAQAAEQ